MKLIIKIIIIFPISLISCLIEGVQAVNIKAQSNGNLILLTNQEQNNILSSYLNSYTDSGDININFGATNTGVRQLNLGSYVDAQDIAIQANNYIITTGVTTISNISNLFITRHTPQGMLDTTFGVNGIQTLLYFQGCKANACALQSDGKIIVAGVAFDNGITHCLLVRYLPNGQLDATFGQNGIVYSTYGYFSNVITLAIQSDDKIIVGGFYYNNGQKKILLARYTIDGALDTSFGQAGMITDSAAAAQIKTILIQPNGKIIISGNTDDKQIVIQCYNTDGTRDNTFDPSFIQTLFLESDLTCISLQEDQKIIVAGQKNNTILLTRINSNGAVDTTFGLDGIVTMSFESEVTVSSLVLKLVTITLVINIENNIYFVRYNQDGLIDPDFGLSGIAGKMQNTSMQKIFNTTLIVDEKEIGTNGGTFNAQIWQTRDLNQIYGNNINVTLGNNQFTLQPGNYLISVTAPAYKVNNHQIRLQNITDNHTETHGSSESASGNSNATSSTTRSSIDSYPLILTKVTTFQVQHKATKNEQNDGLGIASGFGDSEIYTKVKIVQL